MEAEPDDPPGDDALLAAVAGGDRAALRLLYERHSPWLLLRLSRRCADGTIAEEALQETFLAVWRNPDAYRRTGDVPAWLWGIAIRRLVDRLRHRRRLERVPWLGRSRADEPSAEDVVLTGVEYGDLAGALNRLSPELRAVLQATVLDGLTNREAAALLGVPVGTVKSRVSRALAALAADPALSDATETGMRDAERE